VNSLAFCPQGVPAKTRLFDLRPGNLLSFKNRICVVERRLGDDYQLLELETKNPHFLSDEQIAFHSDHGELFMLDGPDSFGKRKGRIPRLIELTQSQKEEVNRKYAYVSACINGSADPDAVPNPDGYTRSRPFMEPIIAQVAAAIGDDDPPGFTTLLGWIDRWLEFSDIYGTASLAARNHLKGPEEEDHGYVWNLAIELGLRSWLRPKVTMAKAYEKVLRVVHLYRLKYGRLYQPEQLDSIKAPSLRTFQRRCQAIDRYTRDYYKKGADYANKKHRLYRKQLIPDRPYEWLDVDHCTLDIALIGVEYRILLGRPDLIIFRCRATGMIVGYAIGYEAPSYTSFLAGLRNTMFPKNLSAFPSVTLPWPCFGRIENLGVDNAMHFVGDSIANAARELRINKPRFQPKSPWLKGALERFFRTLNVGLIHSLPGSTAIAALDDRAIKKLGAATLTLGQFEELLVYWIVMIHNNKPSKGLGYLRGVGDIPIRLWNEKAEHAKSGLLPPLEHFAALAGDTDDRTIQKNGITWDYITYESIDLLHLTVNPNHKEKNQRGGPSRYKVTRDPEDLGHLYVTDPYNKGTVYKIPATESQFPYANGRSLKIHDLYVREAKRVTKNAVNFEAILAAQARLAKLADGLIKTPQYDDVQNRLAKFFEQEENKRRRSQVTTAIPPSEPEHLDVFGSSYRRKSQVIVIDGEFDEARSPAPALPPPSTISTATQSTEEAPLAATTKTATASRKTTVAKQVGSKPAGARAATNQGRTSQSAPPVFARGKELDDLQSLKTEKKWKVRNQ
jgi:putative transposase